jgi:hypothetical protein
VWRWISALGGTATDDNKTECGHERNFEEFSDGRRCNDDQIYFLRRAD